MWSFEVPNAPCGVESINPVGKRLRNSVFLMHRVELKEEGECLTPSELENWFLMHRVELKVAEPPLKFFLYINLGS